MLSLLLLKNCDLNFFFRGAESPSTVFSSLVRNGVHTYHSVHSCVQKLVNFILVSQQNFLTDFKSLHFNLKCLYPGYLSRTILPISKRSRDVTCMLLWNADYARNLSLSNTVIIMNQCVNLFLQRLTGCCHRAFKALIVTKARCSPLPTLHLLAHRCSVLTST